MEILTSVRRLYIRFKSLVNDFVYSFGRAALLLLVEVWSHTVPVRERRRIRVKHHDMVFRKYRRTGRGDPAAKLYYIFVPSAVKALQRNKCVESIPV